MISTSLAEERHDATCEGRMVLALEMIADELKVIGQIAARLEANGKLEKTVAEVVGKEIGSPSEDRWENEGGKPEFHPEPEIKRMLVEHFAVGGYNYTNLAHAIAEAKRARRAALS